MHTLNFFCVSSNLGEDSAFVNIYKGSSTTVSVNAQNGKVLSDVKCKPDTQINKLENRVQFRVAAINVIGQSSWSSPFALRVPDTRTTPCLGNELTLHSL